MEVAVLNSIGKETGRSVFLREDIFGINPSYHTVYLDVKNILANKRQGTHSTKERSFVIGSTRKIKKQKGTGTARAGSIKSPIFRGGGRVFGPHPRYYGFKLNKGQKLLARKSVLSDKYSNNCLLVLEDINLNKPSVKDMMNILNKLSLGDKKTLIISHTNNNNVYLSCRNIKKVNVKNVSSLNTYDMLSSSIIIFLESSIDIINNLLSRKK